mgnify:FL=1|jgi:hypothetical protein
MRLFDLLEDCIGLVLLVILLVGLLFIGYGFGL